MKKLYYIIVLFFAFRICDGQNLVPNGNFEQYSACPSGYSLLPLATSWMYPGTGDADYYHQCATSTSVTVPSNGTGYQIPHSGDAYVGLYLKWSIPEFREYTEVPLTSPLIADSCYFFEMFVSLANSYKFTTDKIGIYFSQTAITGITNPNPLPYSPQIMNTTGNFPDSSIWKPVSGTYTAAGGETHLIIGNFLNDGNTNTNIINPSGYEGAYIYIDDVSLTPCDPTFVNDASQSIVANCFPNPFNQTLTFTANHNEETEFSIYDLQGRMLLKQSFNSEITLNTISISKGIYLYEVKYKTGPDSYRVVKNGKVVKN